MPIDVTGFFAYISKYISFFKDMYLFAKGRAMERVQLDKKKYSEFSKIFSDIYMEGVIKGSEKDYSIDLVSPPREHSASSGAVA